MNNERNKFSEDERILATIVDTAGSLITGSTSLILTIQRESDGYYYDFSDKSFKVSGWTSSGQVMTQLDSTGSPGAYYYDFDASTQGIFGSQRNYYMRATSTSADNSPLEGYFKLGGWIDSVGISGGFTKIGSEITQEVVDEIAKRVWNTVLKGKDTAKDILLRKSEFDATKDYVLTTSDPELQNLLKEIKKIKFPDNSDKIIKALDRLKPIDFNPILQKVLDKIELTVSFFNQGKNDIINTIKSQEIPEYDDTEIKTMMDECKTMVEMMKEDISSRMDCMSEMQGEMSTKEEEMSADNKDKMIEMMDKMEKQAEENQKNIKKILLKMTELRFDSSNENLDDFEYIKDTLSLILDSLGV